MAKTKLYELRVQKNIRQEEMANLVGIRQSTYSRKERGATDVTMDEWILMAKILEVEVNAIFRANSKNNINTTKTTKFVNVPLSILHELEELKKENANLKEELEKLKQQNSGNI